MSTQQSTKKPDWHRADIVAALHKKGTSIRKLSKEHGYASPTTLKNALDRPWPKAERIIADTIGVEPSRIWPSRYPNSTHVGSFSPLESRQLGSAEESHHD